MSNYNSLKATIDANIKQNGNQEITGQILNSVLNAMVTTLGTGYQFAGVATIATNPGTPDAKVFYIANGKGTYEKFGGLEVTEDDVVVFYWDTAWHKVATGIASDQKLSKLEGKILETQGLNIETTIVTVDTATLVSFDVSIPKGSKFFIKATGFPNNVYYLLYANSKLLNSYFYCNVPFEFTADDNIKSLSIKPRPEVTQFGSMSVNVYYDGDLKKIKEQIDGLEDSKVNKTEIVSLQNKVTSLDASLQESKENVSALKETIYGIDGKSYNITGADLVNTLPFYKRNNSGAIIEDIGNRYVSGLVPVQKGEIYRLKLVESSPSVPIVVAFDAQRNPIADKCYFSTAFEEYDYECQEGVAYLQFQETSSAYGYVTLINGSEQKYGLVDDVEALKNAKKLRKTGVIATKGDFKAEGNATFSTDYIIPNGSRIVLDADHRLECFSLTAAIEVINNGKFSIGRVDEMNANAITTSMFSINNGVLEANANANGGAFTDYAQWIVDADGTMPNITDGSKISVTIKKYTFNDDNKEVYVSITDGTDTYSGWFKRYVFANSDNVPSNKFCQDICKMWGKPFIACESGSIKVTNVAYASIYEPISKITIFGDSYIEGGSLVGEGTSWLQNRFAAKIAKDVGIKNVALMCEAGMSLNDKIIAEFKKANEWFYSQYVWIELGANCQGLGVSAFTQKISTIVEYLKGNGQIPILITINPRTDLGASYQTFREGVNAWVRNSGERYVDISKAVSDSADGNWIPSYVLKDGVHPTIEGHAAIYRRAKLDVPEIFEV